MREKANKAPGRRVMQRLAVLAMAASVVLLAVVPSTRASQPALVARKTSVQAKALATVRAIKKGLTVTPPHKKSGKGKVHQSLFNLYFLGTASNQEASLGFTDGTVLHMNQRTNAQLFSPTVTKVNGGEVDEVLAPGSTHSVQTATAVASGIGTEWSVKVKHKKHKKKKGTKTIITITTTTIITVVEGAVLVKATTGAKQSVVVKTDETTTITNNGLPSPPQPTNAIQATSWVNSLPPPPQPLGENIALDANGGVVDSFSSQRASPTSAQHLWDVTNINDGDLSTGWQSAQGHTTNEFVVFRFAGLANYDITEFLLDCTAGQGESADNDLKDFQFWTSTTDNNPGSFNKVFDGQCKRQTGLQEFKLAQPVKATYVKLVALDNWGGADGIAVDEVEIISPDMVSQGHQPLTPVPTPTATNTPAPTSTPTNTPVPTPTPTSTPVPTSTPTAVPAATSTPVPTPTSTAVPPTPTFTSIPPPAPTNTPCNSPACFAR
jgi:hypothetical protein